MAWGRARTILWTALWLGCGSDVDITPDASVPDQSSPDVTASDVISEPVEQYDCCPPLPPWQKFQQQEAVDLCTRLQSCCGDGGFDVSGCEHGLGLLGWESSNADLLVAGVMDGGRLVYDPTAGTSCLAGIATLYCSGNSADGVKIVTANCAAAVTGVGGVTAPCRADSECASHAYCDTSGTCAALLEAGAPCTRTGECAYKGAGALFCGSNADGGSSCQPLAVDDAGLDLGVFCAGDAGTD